jgi:drug/metabolite transporter (DMT)-like permease
MENKQKSPVLLVILAFIALSLIWGSSFILVKKSLAYYSSPQVGALRIFAAFIFFIPVFLKQKHEVKKEHWKSFLLAGLTGNLMPAILFSIAGKHLTSALSGMLNAFTPLFTLIVGILLFKQGFQWRQMIGVALGIIGCFGLIAGGEGFHINFNYHALWVVLATFLYGINSHIVKTKLSGLNPFTSTSGIFMAIGPLSLILLASTGFFSLKIDWWPFLAACFLGVFGSAIAMVLFNQLIKWTSAIVAVSVTYIIPMVAVGWGVLDGEQVYPSQIVAMVVLLIGVYEINRSKA